MNRIKPSFTYCGLTIVLAKPSRFDEKFGSLLSANGGAFFDNECLRPSVNRYQCDIRTLECNEPYLPDTKCVLLLGEECVKKILKNESNTLNEVRGSCYNIDGIVHIASYSPQDTVDVVDREYKTNKLEIQEIDEEDEKKGNELSEKRHHGKTQRKNYRFWLAKDTSKAIRIIKEFGGKIPDAPWQPDYIIYPSSELIIKLLTTTKGQRIFYDCETDENLHIQCFSFSIGYGNPIYCVPCFDHNYSWAYSNLHRIFHALAIAARDNIMVAYNGANFDFVVLGYHYKIAIGHKVEDPMMMQHRCFPSVEKSLGHAISLWTFLKFHKDLGDSGYHNAEQVKQKLLYCGMDVYGMQLVHKAQIEYAKRWPGLLDSFEQVNASIYPYLVITFTGLQYEHESIKQIMSENDKLMMQYLRIINLLVGPKTIETLRRRFKSALPSSNPQCCIYFHDMLGYPIVGRGKPSKKDGSRKASLSKKNIFKLRIKFNNPVIDFIIAYRGLAKETGSLKFNPLYLDDDGKQFNTVDNIAVNKAT